MKARLPLSFLAALALSGGTGCPNSSPTPDGGSPPDAGPVPDAGPGQDAGPTDGGLSDGGSDAGTPYDAFCHSFMQAECTKMVACGFWSNVRDCMSEKIAFFCQANSVSAAAGFQTFNPSLAASCLGKVQARAGAGNNCPDFGSELFTGDTDCAGALTAAVASGGNCYQPTDCIDPTQSCGQGACGQTCRTGGAPGQPCFPFATCTTGYCDANNICQNWVGVGNPCPTGAECDPSSASCNASGQCVALPGLNQTCIPTNFNACAAAYYCDSTTSKCLANPTVGQPCSPNGTCAAGLWCDSGGTGNCLALAAAGASCNVNTPQQCQSPLTCLGSTSTCQPLVGLGQACLLDSDCAIFASLFGIGGCDLATHQCIVGTTVAPGATCSTWHSCPTGYSCLLDGGTSPTCLLEHFGDTCTNRAGCPVLNGCANGTCVTSTPGNPCDRNNECVAGSYCNGFQTCLAMATHGQPCDLQPLAFYGNSCVAPDFCQPVLGTDAGTCGPMRDAGAACDTVGTWECQYPDFCLNGTCTQAGHQGQPCMPFFPAICVAGACAVDAGANGTCVPGVGLGRPCVSSSDCATGVCLGGTCQACN